MNKNLKKKLIAGLLCYALLLVFVANDAWLYSKPIGKIIQLSETKTGVTTAARGGEEHFYEQRMKVKILNGSEKGKVLGIKQTYSSSRVIEQKYHKGDKVLLNSRNGKPINSIKTQKRDTYVVALFGLIVWLLLVCTGKQGARTCVTLVVNIGIYVAGFMLYLNGQDLLRLCNLLVILFTVSTLVLSNGFQRKTVVAIVSSLCVFSLIIGLFFFALHTTEPFDYGTMEYLGSTENPEDLFVAEVMFAGLGAIMDVAVTISAAMEELIRKKPNITMAALFRSGREIGYDIMGTMINVLLFTFAAGLIPSFLLRMNNDIAFFTNVRYYIPFEISRFLIESIGIVSAIPISIFISAGLFRFRRKESAI